MIASVQPGMGARHLVEGERAARASADVHLGLLKRRYAARMRDFRHVGPPMKAGA
jgi:hypothetical protein